MDEQRRVLVIANETVAGEAVVAEVRYRAGSEGAGRVLVVAPALHHSRIAHFLDGDNDRAESGARERLDRSVQALRSAGLDATGELGDANPLQALDDAYRVFQPHEIVISTHPPARSHWLERKVVAKARERFQVPVTHVVVDLEHEASRTHEDPRPGPARPRRTVTLFHTEPYDEAIAVREHGFRHRRQSGAGVMFDEAQPHQAPDDAEVVFALTLPEELAAEYEVAGEGASRRFSLPPDLIDRHEPWIATTETAE